MPNKTDKELAAELTQSFITVFMQEHKNASIKIENATHILEEFYNKLHSLEELYDGNKEEIMKQQRQLFCKKDPTE